MWRCRRSRLAFEKRPGAGERTIRGSLGQGRTAGYAGGGNKFDLENWNAEYFTRLRAFLAEAERHAIVVEITLFSSQYAEAQWAMSPLIALTM